MSEGYRLVKLGEPKSASLEWFDNHRLFVIKSVTADGSNQGQLVLWDTATGKTEPSPQGFPPAFVFCYDPDTGYVRGQDYSGRTVAGWPGRLQLESNNEARVYDVGVTCRPPWQGPLPGELRDKLSATRLAGDDGFLWPTKFTGQNNPVVGLYDATGHKVADLPFTAVEMNGGVRYAPFKRAHFIARERVRDYGQSIGPELLLTDDPHIGWWVYPNGRVQQVVIPPRSWIAPEHAGSLNSTSYTATAHGMFFYYGARRSGGDYGYLAIDEQRLIKVVAGAMPGVHPVSPNGCKIAFTYSDKIGTLQEESAFVDLCQAARP